MFFPFHPLSDRLLPCIKLPQCPRFRLLPRLRQILALHRLTTDGQKFVAISIQLETLLGAAQVSTPLLFLNKCLHKLHDLLYFI